MSIGRERGLVPKAALRLAALGTLWEGEKRYADVALEAREFVARFSSPAPEILSTSIELLKLEGLIEEIVVPGGCRSDEVGESNPLLRITESGVTALASLLKAPLNPKMSDITRLAVALKLRFVHALSPAERAEEVAGLQAMYEAERERLATLLAAERNRPTARLLCEWLTAEIRLIDDHLQVCANALEPA